MNINNKMSIVENKKEALKRLQIVINMLDAKHDKLIVTCLKSGEICLQTDINNLERFILKDISSN